MALSATTIHEVWTTGDDTNNGGMFDPGQTAGMLTDGAATAANTTAPVFTSVSYAFVAGDVGAWVYLSSGTTGATVAGGWYKIASVSGGAATLNGTIGQGVLKTVLTPTTVVGCANGASPTVITWTIDYSQQAAAQFTYVDLASVGAGLLIASAAKPFGKQHVGNSLVITGGTNLNTGRYVIASVAAVTFIATVVGPTNITSGAGLNGTGGMGGAFASPGILGALWVSGNHAFVKTGTYTLSSASANVSGGTVLVSTAIFVGLEGYGTIRGDKISPPTIINAAFTAINIVSSTSGRFTAINLIVDGNNGATVVAFNLNSSPGIAYLCKAQNCGGNGFTNGGAFPRTQCIKCVATACSVGFNVAICCGCEAISNTSAGFSQSTCSFCISRSNTGAGFTGGGGFGNYVSCVSFSNGGAGFSQTQNQFVVSSIADSNTGVGFSGDNNNGVQGFFINCAGRNNSSLSNQNFIEDPAIIALTASPFVNAAGGNFALNNAAGGGALLRAAGFPGTFPAGTTIGYLDIGAVQSKPSGFPPGIAGVI